MTRNANNKVPGWTKQAKTSDLMQYFLDMYAPQSQQGGGDYLSYLMQLLQQFLGPQGQQQQNQAPGQAPAAATPAETPVQVADDTAVNTVPQEPGKLQTAAEAAGLGYAGALANQTVRAARGTPVMEAYGLSAPTASAPGMVSKYLGKIPGVSKVMSATAPARSVIGLGLRRVTPFLPYGIEGFNYLTGNAPSAEDFQRDTTWDLSRGLWAGGARPLVTAMDNPVRSIYNIGAGGIEATRRAYNNRQEGIRLQQTSQARQQAQSTAEAFTPERLRLMAQGSAGYYFDPKYQQYMPTEQTFYQEGRGPNLPAAVNTWRQRVLKSAPGWKPEGAGAQPTFAQQGPPMPTTPKPPVPPQPPNIKTSGAFASAPTAAPRAPYLGPAPTAKPTAQPAQRFRFPVAPSAANSLRPLTQFTGPEQWNRFEQNHIARPQPVPSASTAAQVPPRAPIQARPQPQTQQPQLQAQQPQVQQTQAPPAWANRFASQISRAQAAGNMREVRRLQRMQAQPPPTIPQFASMPTPAQAGQQLAVQQVSMPVQQPQQPAARPAPTAGNATLDAIRASRQRLQQTNNDAMIPRPDAAMQGYQRQIDAANSRAPGRDRALSGHVAAMRPRSQRLAEPYAGERGTVGFTRPEPGEGTPDNFTLADDSTPRTPVYGGRGFPMAASSRAARQFGGGFARSAPVLSAAQRAQRDAMQAYREGANPTVGAQRNGLVWTGQGWTPQRPVLPSYEYTAGIPGAQTAG